MDKLTLQVPETQIVKFANNVDLDEVAHNPSICEKTDYFTELVRL